MVALVLVASLSASCGVFGRSSKKTAPPPTSQQTPPATSAPPSATPPSSSTLPPPAEAVPTEEVATAPVVEPPPPPPPPPVVKSLNVCGLLKNMKPCWQKATALLARIQSCGQLGQTYGQGVREELDRLGVESDNRGAEAAAFACAGLCAVKRNESGLTWRDACLTAASAMKCDRSACN